jgi:hypothetical protein
MPFLLEASKVYNHRRSRRRRHPCVPNPPRGSRWAERPGRKPLLPETPKVHNHRHSRRRRHPCDPCCLRESPCRYPRCYPYWAFLFLHAPIRQLLCSKRLAWQRYRPPSLVPWNSRASGRRRRLRPFRREPERAGALSRATASLVQLICRDCRAALPPCHHFR